MSTSGDPYRPGEDPVGPAEPVAGGHEATGEPAGVPATTEAPPTPAAEDRGAAGPKHATGSKTSAVFVFSALGAIILLLLLIFILQNLKRVPIEFLGLEGTVPVGVALLLAAVAGALLVAIAGGLRILQLRRRADSWSR